MPALPIVRSWIPAASWLVLCWLFAAASLSAGEVRIVRDISYRPETSDPYQKERCLLDLYLPVGAANFPTMIWFYGGSLQNGSKSGENEVLVANRFAGEGIAVATVNYRLHPRVTFPAYVDDAAAATAHVLKHIADYQGASNKVFVSGHSAGGYLVAMIGLDAGYLRAHGASTANLAGLLPISGQMVTHSTVRIERKIPETQPVIDSAAPAFHVRADAPPMLAIAGSQDNPARPEENRYVIAALKAVGHRDATYLEFEGRTHATIANQLSRADDPVAKAMLAFMHRLRP